MPFPHSQCHQTRGFDVCLLLDNLIDRRLVPQRSTICLHFPHVAAAATQTISDWMENDVENLHINPLDQ